ncbi:MAG: 1-(5-phosphoribosyl)-5-[(5-phosphoribosylamino)methylideneamino]imidazole-4-carboxamide isomerase [Promethearchaeota archaeon]
MKFVIPAIDIQDGKCVRLTRGEIDKKTVYYEDPIEALKFWENVGAEWIHIVDLDGAFGIGTNFKLIEKMVSNSNLKIQVGGGIRNIEKAKKLVDLGVERVVVGTRAVKDPPFIKELKKVIGKESIVVALDFKDGKPAIKGWVETINEDIFKLAKKIEDLGSGYILMSSVRGDGAFTGPDIENTKRMVESVDIPVIAAGGIRNKSDILSLKSIGVFAVIVGKAFYEKKINYEEVKDI